MSTSMWDAVLEDDDLAALDPAALRLRLRDLAISSEQPDVAAAVDAVADAFDPAGPLTRLLEEPEVTDVLVNGPREVWVEKAGDLVLTDLRFEPPSALDDLIERLLGRAGTRADLSRPIAAARLTNGARMHVVLPPVAPDGPLVSIRKHQGPRFDLERLVELGACSQREADELRRLVAARTSLVISGATGSGKTTLLSALIGAADPRERVVIVEETAELACSHPHVVSLLTRPANVEGTGAVNLETLVAAALRMRPDRIAIGEVRGAEASAALQAFATGHRGSMLTVHASSPEAAVDRLIALALKDPRSGSEDFVRRSVLAAVGAVVHLGRVEGRRALESISAIG